MSTSNKDSGGFEMCSECTHERLEELEVRIQEWRALSRKHRDEAANHAELAKVEVRRADLLAKECVSLRKALEIANSHIKDLQDAYGAPGLAQGRMIDVTAALDTLQSERDEARDCIALLVDFTEKSEGLELADRVNYAKEIAERVLGPREKRNW